jgi:hypothetical protein
MRALFIGLFVVFAAPTYGADKEEDKAKQVTEVFLKAVIAKDIDAVMKTVDVPFVWNLVAENENTTQEREQLQRVWTEALKRIDPAKAMALQVGKVYDMAAFASYAKNNLKGDKAKRLTERAEKLVGKSGYMVMYVVKGEEKEVPGALIRIKDGKAFVASVER